MSKMHYFSNKFLKSPSAGGSPPLAYSFLRFWWFEFAWFGQTVVFQTNYDEIKL